MVRRLLRRPEAALCALVLCAYGYFYQAGGWNQNTRFDLTRAIVEQGTSSIERYHHNTGDKALRDGVHYSDKAPGLSWLAVPAYAVAWQLHRGDEPPSRRFLDRAAYASTLWAVALPSALAVVLLYLMMGALGAGRAAAVAVALAYALATLAWPYSTLLYGHQLAGALLLSGFALLVLAHRGHPCPLAAGEGRAVWKGRALLAGAGVLLGYAVVVEYTAALAVLPICVYAAWFVRPLSRLGWLVAGGAVCAVALAAYHALVFGGPFTFPYDFSTQDHRGQGWFMGLGMPAGDALGGILISPYRGLLYSAPWLALAVPGLVVMLRRPALRAEGAVCAAVIPLFLWMNASLVDWQGGWAMGARYLIPSLPFWALCAGALAIAFPPPLLRLGSHSAPATPPVALSEAAQPRSRRALWASRAGWAIALALTAYSALLMLAGTAVKPEVPTHIARPFSGWLLPRFYDGSLAVSTQSIDMIGHPQAGPTYAFNLGQVLGLDGLTSLLPLLVAVAAAATWLVFTLRRPT
jgi:hypothetical protein